MASTYGLLSTDYCQLLPRNQTLSFVFITLDYFYHQRRIKWQILSQ
jgi:hypothetical protein